jgi:phosphatidate cytidylyltransferase
MGDWTPADRRFSELPARLLSAIILIPLALGAVWVGGFWLAAACAVFAYVMMMEWCGMSASPNQHVLAGMSGLFALSLPFEVDILTPALAAATFSAAVFGARPGIKQRVTAGFGVIYVFAMIGCLYQLREGPWDGRFVALYFMSFVWASDSAAYFAGRALGGPKLLPKESPNKTWSGAVGAVVACGICGYFASAIEGVNPLPWIACGMVISVMAQVGDLFESGLKRRFNVKDSGHILPGHGGLLDRVDGLGAVCVAGVLALTLLPNLSPMLGL